MRLGIGRRYCICNCTFPGHITVTSTNLFIFTFVCINFVKETYGNVSSDSSDDEDWNDSTAPRKRKKTTEQLSSVSPNGDAKVINYDHEGNEHSPRTTYQKSVVKGTHNSPGKSLEDSPKSNSTSGRAKSSSSRRLGEAVIQVQVILWEIIRNDHSTWVY